MGTTTLIEELEQAATFVDEAAEEERISAAEWAEDSRDLTYRAFAARLRARAEHVREVLKSFEGYHTGDAAVKSLTGSLADPAEKTEPKETP